jgi:ABC-type glycerol-3-phosphate transport system substrate-binding protein
MAPKLTKRDRQTTNITQSAVSFGEYVNVDNAKDIIAMLFLQVGNPIVSMVGGEPLERLTERKGEQVVPNENVVSALRFFMDFSNPLKSIYTWNRSLKNSHDEFIEGNLAVYFGHTSEYRSLQEKNPHLNFSVAPIPQPRETTTEITLARVHGLAVLKTSRNKQTAFIAVQRLLDKKPSQDFAAAFDLPPVRRDLLNIRPTDAAASVFFDSAIRSRTWLDPQPSETDVALRQAVESISSGRDTVPQAVILLDRQLKSLLTPYQK